MRGTLRVLAGLLAIVPLVAVAPLAPAQPAAPAAVELTAQSPVTSPRATVQISVRLPGVPTDGNLRLTVHGRVRSRSELASSMDGDSLRNEVFQTVVPLGTLPPAADGSRTIALSLDPATGGVALSAGVYPLELVARDAANVDLAQLVTHLVVPPTNEGSPPLAVAPLAEIAAAALPRAAGAGATLDPATTAALGDLIAAVGADKGTTLVVGPETLDALDDTEGGAEVVSALRGVAASHPVLAQPYVSISLDALSTARLTGEIAQQTAHGRATVEPALGVTTVGGTWLAGGDLGAAGLRVLQQTGTKHVVVPSSLVEPLPDGVLDLSLAQPFLLDPPRTEHAEGTGTLTAMAIDPIVAQRLTSEGTAALVANRAIAELAAIWFEQPGIPRAEVVPLAPTLAPDLARTVLEGLAGSPVFATTSLDSAFTTASPLLDPADDPVHRPLTPGPMRAFSPAAVAGIQGARSSLESARGMVGTDSPLLPPVEAQLLLATANQLEPAVRQQESAAVQRSIDALEDTVTGPVSFTLTLTARKGTIPLTLHNDSGVPLHVVIHLRSTKLSFPNGNDMSVELKEAVTRFDIPVRPRASGAFPLAITVTTPDGAQQLVTSRYTVRSTAVAGAGLVLGIGAGLFLLVWWARHWRNTRRNARLVAAHTHPATGPEAGG